MSSFYEKLAMKIQDGAVAASTPTAGNGQSGTKTVTYNATGDRTSPKKEEAPAAAPPVDVAPDGTDPIDVDLFQSDLRMVIFMHITGIHADGISITVSEESNCVIVEGVQKRPAILPVKDAKEGEPVEKGIYTKQEIKWHPLYRKVYLPAVFDAGDVDAVLDNGILIITLPVKKPGAGKKITIREKP